MISQLINKLDTFDLVMRQVAQVLANEQVSQLALATDEGLTDLDAYNFKVYLERQRPWSQWQDGDTDSTASVVNVAFDTDTLPPGRGNTVSRQTAEGTFNIDVYSPGYARALGGGGHISADEDAATRCYKVAALVRNILMAGAYVRLDLPAGTIGGRWVQSRTSFQLPLELKTAQLVKALRVPLQVQYNETAPQVEGDTCELIHIELKRASDDSVLATLGFPEND